METVQHLPYLFECPRVRTGGVGHAILLARKHEAELGVNWALQSIWMAGGVASSERHLHFTFPRQLYTQDLCLYVAARAGKSCPVFSKSSPLSCNGL